MGTILVLLAIASVIVSRLQRARQMNRTAAFSITLFPPNKPMKVWIEPKGKNGVSVQTKPLPRNGGKVS